MGFLRRLLGGGDAKRDGWGNVIPTVDDGKSDAWLVDPVRPDAVLEVVGESFYQDNLRRIGGRSTEDGVTSVDHIAALVPDPKNKYDENAIAIGINGLKVGHLSRADAIAFQPLVRWAKSRDHFIAGHARLTGGWDRGGGDRGTIGVILHIGTAAETLAELLLDEQRPRMDHRWAGLTVAFTGASRFSFAGARLDDAAMTILAQAAGLKVHPRVTKAVQLLVECESVGSANSVRAAEYGLEIVAESAFWPELGIDVAPIAWHGNR